MMRYETICAAGDEYCLYNLLNAAAVLFFVFFFGLPGNTSFTNSEKPGLLSQLIHSLQKSKVIVLAFMNSLNYLYLWIIMFGQHIYKSI